MLELFDHQKTPVFESSYGANDRPPIVAKLPREGTVGFPKSFFRLLHRPHVGIDEQLKAAQLRFERVIGQL